MLSIQLSFLYLNFPLELMNNEKNNRFYKVNCPKDYIYITKMQLVKLHTQKKQYSGQPNNNFTNSIIFIQFKMLTINMIGTFKNFI